MKSYFVQCINTLPTYTYPNGNYFTKGHYYWASRDCWNRVVMIDNIGMYSYWLGDDFTDYFNEF